MIKVISQKNADSKVLKNYMEGSEYQLLIRISIKN